MMNRGVATMLLVLFQALAAAQTNLQTCNVAIDIGHSRLAQGSISARGIGEYEFNRAMANLLVEKLHKDDIVKAFVVEVAGTGLEQRTQIAVEHHATLFISIHHDSVQPKYLSTWIYKGKAHHYSDKFHGFSLFVSEKAPHAKESLALAESIGTQLVTAGFVPTFHHAEKIPGENRVLLDQLRGIYSFDDLLVLKTANMPALLLESGVIVNRSEELLLEDTVSRARMVQAIAEGVEQFCK